jgi:hypothetical protein
VHPADRAFRRVPPGGELEVQLPQQALDREHGGSLVPSRDSPAPTPR